MYTASVKTVGESMARSTTEARSFKIFMDEPPELGGRDGAASPLEAHPRRTRWLPELHDLLHRQGAGHRRQGHRDRGDRLARPRQVRRNEPLGPRRLPSIHVNIKVHADASAEELEMLKREVETRCPVSDNIANPTPVNITVSATRVLEAVA